MLGALWAPVPAAAGPLWPAVGGTNEPCFVWSQTLFVNLSLGDAQTSLKHRGSRFFLDGVACTGDGREVESVAVTDADGHDADLQITVSGGRRSSRSGRLAWDVSLGNGSDRLTLKGSTGDNTMNVFGSRADLDGDSSRDLVARGIESIELNGGPGDDRLRSRPMKRRTRADGDGRGGNSSPAALENYATARIFGGAGNDTISGDNNVNFISAGAGNDTVYAKGADDEIQGGAGDDVLWAGDGDDFVNGGTGQDREFGAGNNDTFQQGPQEYFTTSTPVTIPDVGEVRSNVTVPATTLDAVDVNVRIYIDHPRTQDLWITLINPTGVRTRLSEGRGNGTPFNGTHFDSEAHTNIRSAGSKNLAGRFHPEWSMEPVQAKNPTGEWSLLVEDKISGSTGTIRGWELQVGETTAASNGADELSGGSGGFDLVLYSQRTEPVNATLLGGADDGQAGELDSLGTTITCPASSPPGSQCADLEWMYGGSADDTITGTDQVNDLRGFGGHDTITALDGADQIRGVNGRDAISAGAGNDAIHGQGNPDTIDGGDGFDRAMYGYATAGMVIDVSDPAAGSASDGAAGNDDDVVSFVENITGTNFDDRILGARNLANVFSGGSGNDYLNGGTGTGTDNLNGAAGTDTCLNAEIRAECEVLTVPDEQPPTVPANLRATVGNTYDVSLSWDASTDDVGLKDYVVYRDGTFLARSANESYTDAGLTPGASHTYTVTAFDVAGNESAPSAPLDVVADNGPPSTPTDLVATLDADENVALSWQAATDDVGVTRYGVYRDGLLLDHSTTESYLDTTALRGATYSYTVTALDGADNESQPSDPAEITIGDAQPPSVPQDLAVQALSTRKLELTWSASTDDSGGVTYDVYKGENLLSSTTDTGYVDDTLAPGESATYTVVARDGAGNLSDPSTPAGGTTFPLLLEDDFSTGDLSKWTSSTGMSVTVPSGVEFGPAALAQSDGTQRSFASVSLADEHATIYMRTKVRIDSQSTVTNLLRFHNSSGSPVLTVFSSAGRNLMLRNDTANSNVWSPATLALGQWHDLQVGVTVNGASSEVRVWLDGAPVTQLTGTMSLGTNAIRELRIGDNSLNRRYEVFFDDVAAAGGKID